jgi:hypothetical protein
MKSRKCIRQTNEKRDQQRKIDAKHWTQKDEKEEEVEEEEESKDIQLKST